MPNSISQTFRHGKTNVIMVALPSTGLPFFMEWLDGIYANLDGKYSIVQTETP